MDEQQFKHRTKQLGLQAICLVEELPKNRPSDVIGRQLLRSATAIGANYRAACRGRSSADVLSKLGVVEEETDETLYWLELLAEAKLVSPERLAGLMSETEEILAMTVASIKTLRLRTVVVGSQSKIQNSKSKIC